MTGAYSTVIAALVTGILGYTIAWLQIHLQLRVDFDKDMRAERMQAYKKLVTKLACLPKYPEPIPIGFKDTNRLAISLRDWYFQEGGLFLSEISREKYFDLQDALKIIHLKQQKKWDKSLSETEDEGALRKYLTRNEAWSPPDKLKTIAGQSLNFSDSNETPLSPEVVDLIRGLASDLRTSLTRDIHSRKYLIAKEG